MADALNKTAGCEALAPAEASLAELQRPPLGISFRQLLPLTLGRSHNGGNRDDRILRRPIALSPYVLVQILQIIKYSSLPEAMVLSNHQTVEDSPEAGTLDGVDAAIHIYGLPPDIQLAELKYCFHQMGDITDIQSSGDGHALVVTIPWFVPAQASVAKYHEGSFDGRKIGVELRLAAANTSALNYVPRGESTGRYRKSKKEHRPHQAPPLTVPCALGLALQIKDALATIAASLAQIPLLRWDWFDKRTPRGLTKCDPTRSSPILVRKYWLRHLLPAGFRSALSGYIINSSISQETPLPVM
ncbi:hypothetical protein B0H13DRAFT_2332305 [Mycena leptocephala]|nr:hypothetical protein B0H13DRAFT_2332305 [Mycena leptocephala]